MEKFRRALAWRYGLVPADKFCIGPAVQSAYHHYPIDTIPGSYPPY